ncbi:MAG TPA: DUF1700 domain-containing protein [Gammaproteobacteria bacterium]|jgi:uncharacterized membrane protein|nr:DUF1700 domain-containing protein [Gammaproteobacteria bacterium]
MRKQDFLKELEAKLNCLLAEERKEILRDIEEYFDEGHRRNQSDEEIIKKLGSAKAISETIIAEAKVKRISHATTFSQKIFALLSAFFAILLLTPFNLIFVLIPLLIITSIIVSGWPVVLAMIVSLPVAVILGMIFAINVGFHLFTLLAILFFVIAWISAVITITIGFTCLTLAYFKGVAKLFLWNINFIKNRARGG